MNETMATLTHELHSRNLCNWYIAECDVKMIYPDKIRLFECP